MKIFTISNCITLINLFFGCILSVMIINQDNLDSIGFILICVFLLDILDGFFARLFQNSSILGVHLDSLADIISFGLVPGLLTFNLLKEISFYNTYYIKYLGFIVTIFSSIRLAKFNTEKHKFYFQGLNTPTSTLFIFSLYYLFYEYHYDWIINPYFLILLIAILSYLLISPIPMFSLKFNRKILSNNSIIFIFFPIVLSSFLLFHIQSIPFLIIFYIIYSILIKKSM